MENEEPFLILYVEDDPAHAEFTMRNFKRSRMNPKFTHLPDGQQALDYLFFKGKYKHVESAPRPNLILLDLRLPKVDGLEVLRTIKSDEMLRCIPVVILTTSESEIDIAQAYQSYANSYLVKSLDIAKFSNMVESVAFYWMMWNKYVECDTE